MSVNYPSASLKPYKEESLVSGHAWIFSGALQQPPRWIETGGLVDVKSSKGQFVARGYYNPQTDIAIRILTRNPEEAIDAEFVRDRVRQAVELRRVFQPEQTNAYRLIHSGGDGLPGLVVDRFADILVMQIHTAGMERLRPLLIEALLQETGISGILLRNDSMSRRREGLEVEEPVVVTGEVSEHILIRENGVQFLVDPWQGQKTGFSLYEQLTKKDTTVTSIDISSPAIEASRKNFELNSLNPDDYEFRTADVFSSLEEMVEHGEQFDVVVLDPPAFAKTQSARNNALKAYRRLNALGMQVLRPCGILLTCSCSGVVGMDDLLGVLSQSAQRFQRPVQLLETYTHGVDHPINLAMPETAYLKAVFCRV